jgi:hypothetical protein
MCVRDAVQAVCLCGWGARQAQGRQVLGAWVMRCRAALAPTPAEPLAHIITRTQEHAREAGEGGEWVVGTWALTLRALALGPAGSQGFGS